MLLDKGGKLHPGFRRVGLVGGNVGNLQFFLSPPDLINIMRDLYTQRVYFWSMTSCTKLLVPSSHKES